MHTDPLVLPIAGTILVIVLIAFALRRIRQPLVIAYLLAGLALGPQVTGLIQEGGVLEQLGGLGVVLLLFFVGMEISPDSLIQRWRVAVIGTAFQVLISVACVAAVGSVLDWQWPRIILLGFVISLSSTAVVLKLLQREEEPDPEVGQDVTAILLAQDLAIVPMMIVITLLSGAEISTGDLSLQGAGALAATLLAIKVCRSDNVRLPFGKALQTDPELQVFVALLFCFGFALAAASLQLSAALGAFLAGLFVGAAKETKRFHEHLKPFEVVFVAIFFVSIGMLIDLEFLREQWVKVAALVGLVLVTNTLINAAVLRGLGLSWRRSFHAASLLAQVGEFSFVLAIVGFEAGIIGEFAYQTTISVISLSLLVSPAWIGAVKRLTRE